MAEAVLCEKNIRQITVNFYLALMLIRVEKPYLKSSFSLLLRKKWTTKISRFLN